MNYITINRQDYSNAIQLKLPLDYIKIIPEDDEIHTFLRVMGRINTEKYLPVKVGRGRKGYNPKKMLNTVLFAYMNQIYSLRQIEKAIKTDIRFMYLMEEEEPSFKTIGEFISSLEGTIHDIYVEINKAILSMDDSIEDKETLYIDGTAYEANARKTSFVWKKTAMNTQDRKLRQANELKDKLKDIKKFQSIKSSADIDKLLEQIREQKTEEMSGFVYGRGKRKKPLQRIYDELVKVNEVLRDAEERISICGEDRNSYSKTDHDATMMHMKYDYYNNTGVFKPGYNLQAAVSDEYVTEILVSNARADSKTLPLTIERYKEDYGGYPIKAVADAGYGSYTNYMYLLSHGIEAYVKYNTYRLEKQKGLSRFHSRNFQFDGEKSICPEGKELTFEKEGYTYEDGYLKITNHYRCHDCERCRFKKECTKSEYGRVIQKNFILDELKDNARKLLDSEEGLIHRQKRSIYTEGVFGVIKQDYGYIRLHRRGFEKTELELTLVIIGFNLNKYHNKLHRSTMMPA